MSTALVSANKDDTPPPSNALLGTVVSSLHKLKDTSNQDGAFFIFGDLSVRHEGKFRLLFTLYKMENLECIHITSTLSTVFTVFAAKNFPGLAESTFLTRSFSDQGVRLRLRKDSRTMTTKKRSQAAADIVGGGYHRDERANNAEGLTQMDPRTRAPYPSPTAAPIYDNQAGNYPYDTEPMGKRQRVDTGPAYGHAMATYDRGFSSSMTVPAATTTTYNLPSHPATPASHYAQHNLARLETQHMGSYPAVSRDYRTHPGPGYFTSNASADASPRTHPTPNANLTPSSSTSPPEQNYTSSGPIGGFAQMAGYSYTPQPLSDASTLSLPSIGDRPNGLPSMPSIQSSLTTSLGVDMNSMNSYEIDRSNPGHNS
jgi:hypothetical protein